MTNTKNFELTELDGCLYEISVDYEQDGSIVAIFIEGDLKYVLNGDFVERVEEAFLLEFNDE